MAGGGAKNAKSSEESVTRHNKGDIEKRNAKKGETRGQNQFCSGTVGGLVK